VQTLFDKYAEVLVDYSLRLKTGDKLLIQGSYLAEGLIKAVYERAIKAGAHPEFKIALNGTERIFYENASDDQLKSISPTAKMIIGEYDALLNITSPFNMKELQSIPADKKQMVSIARTEINKTFMTRAAAGELNWTLCVFPTDAASQEAGMSLAEYEDFVYGACFLFEDDPVGRWQKLRDDQQSVVDFLNGKKKIRYASADVDVEFSVDGRTWLNSAGTNNMPSGEVFTAPVEDSVNGKVRFSFPGFFMARRSRTSPSR
jgi:aminopeptidase